MTWGGRCPNCGSHGCDRLTTDNEWLDHCVGCDIRFNSLGEVRPDDRPKLSRSPASDRARSNPEVV